MDKISEGGRFVLVPSKLIEGKRMVMGPNSRQKLGEVVAQFVENPGALVLEDIPYKGINLDIIDFKPNESLPNEMNPYVRAGLSSSRDSSNDIIVSGKKKGFFNRQSQIEFLLTQALDAEGAKKIFDVAFADKKKKILIISGHGGSQFLGLGEKYNVDMKVETILQNLDVFISKNGEKVSFQDVYSCIILVSCNIGNHSLSQEIVNNLGVPVAYTLGHAGIEVTNTNVSKTIVAVPE